MVYKHRTVEEAERLRCVWERERVEARSRSWQADKAVGDDTDGMPSSANDVGQEITTTATRTSR